MVPVAVIMTKTKYQSMVMKHFNSDAYEHIQDKNMDDAEDRGIYKQFTKRHTTGMRIEYLMNFKFTTSNFYILPKILKSEEVTELVKANPVDYLKIKNPPEIASRPIVAGTNLPTQ